MSVLIRQTLLVLLVIFGVRAYASDPSGSNVAAPPSNRVDRISVEDAFRRALGAIKQRVNLMDTNADFRVSRTGGGDWLVHVRQNTDVPPGGVSVLVDSRGSVELRLSRTNTDAGAWLSSGEASKPELGIKVRPEVAFRRGLEALTKWWKVSPECFFAPQGKIDLFRTGKEEWAMTISGYSDTGHGEWRVTIKENEAYARPIGLGL